MAERAESRHPTKSPEALARWGLAVVAAALVIAVPVATWWLVGDQSTVPVSVNPDYTFKPFDVTPRTQRTAGVASAVLTIVALLMLARATRRKHLDPQWWRVLIPLLVAGLIVGYGWRVMTAGVIGANIGAGLVVLFAGPVVAALLIWSLAYSIYVLHHRRAARLTCESRGT
ncbi:hypothetical protein [Micromonospora sp. NBC_00617]|uniref:hypothetical protein n=1 Tax=Micromonospora sp. NBC_00617 TaxID=2903587 RepID=UPI0030E3BAD0